MGETELLQREWLKCQRSVAYFIHEYCHIYDATSRKWIPFKLWDEQYSTLKDIDDNLLVVILKARQLGFTWLCLAYMLWLMLFHPAATVLIFSRRDEDAIYLMTRMTGMYKRLPQWMHARRILTSNAHTWQLSNGSIAYAFPTTGGDSYTATAAMVDEADLVPNLDDLMNAVKPTIDGGGRMILLSRSNKKEPNSTFKKIYKAARALKNGWKAVFVPWQARPSRDGEWWEAQKADIFSRTGSLDDLHQQYPATDEEALQPNTMDKRIPSPWLRRNYIELEPASHTDIAGLKIFASPDGRGQYVIGADPAEGNPTSDYSAITVMNAYTGEQVAKLNERIEPTAFARIVWQISELYNNAPVMPERNNHGHTVIAWLSDNTSVEILSGLDGRPGWQTNIKSKALMYDKVAAVFKSGNTIIHDAETYYQLAAIEGNTLRAPGNDHDDLAMAYGLGIIAIHGEVPVTVVHSYMNEHAPAGKRGRPQSRQERARKLRDVIRNRK